MQRLHDTSENTHIVEWRIQNFSRCNIQRGEKLECPVGILLPTRWTFYIYPHGKDDSDFLSCYVNSEMTENSGPRKNEIEFEFSLIAGNGEVAYTKFGRSRSEGNVTNGFTKFLKLKDIFENKDIYLQFDTLTIRCTLRILGAISLPTYEIFRTEFPLKKCTTRLALQEYHGKTKQNPQIFGFEDFLSLYVCMNKDGSFQKQIEVSAVEFESSEARESFLRMVMVKNKPNNPIYLSCRIKVLNNKMVVALEKAVSHLFSKSGEIEDWVLPSLINTEDLPQDCTEDGTILLEVELLICDLKPLSNEVTDLNALNLKADSKESNLVKEPEGLHKVSDAILRVDNETFHVHISILGAKSPRFQQIFRSLLKEKTENSQHIVKIDDVNKKTMSLLLKFIYTNQLKELENLSNRQCFLLYAAAQKYQVSTLQSRCISYFRNSLSVGYVFHALMMATSWNDLDLKRVALDRFADHHENLLTSPEWDEFIESHEKLAYQVLRHLRFKNL